MISRDSSSPRRRRRSCSSPAQIGKCLPITGLGPELHRDRCSILRPPGPGNQQAGRGKRSRRSGADMAVALSSTDCAPSNRMINIETSFRQATLRAAPGPREAGLETSGANDVRLSRKPIRDGATRRMGLESPEPRFVQCRATPHRRLDGPCAMTGAEEGHRTAGARDLRQRRRLWQG